MSIWIGTGLGIAGLLLAAKAWLTQPGGNVRPHQIRPGPFAKPRGDVQECIWCDRMISLPAQACSTICDYDLKHLALSHPDAICRAELQEMEYQWFGEAKHDAENGKAPE